MARHDQAGKAMDDRSSLAALVPILTRQQAAAALLLGGGTDLLVALRAVVPYVWCTSVARSDGDAYVIRPLTAAGQTPPPPAVDVILMWHPETLVDRPESLPAALCDRLCPGGMLIALTQLVPGSDLRGKKANRERAAGAYISALVSLRSGHPVNARHEAAWRRGLADSGYGKITIDPFDVRQTVEAWCAGMPLGPADPVRLRAMIQQAPELAAAYLQPTAAEGPLAFRQQLAVVTAINVGNSQPVNGGAI
jgi:hypothetical protein